MTVKNVLPEILPPSVQQIAGAQQLGPFVKVYGASLARTTQGALLFLVGSVFFFVGGTFASDIPDVTRRLLFALALFFLCLTIYLLSTVIRGSNQRIYLFQQGLIVDKNNRAQALPWKKIDTVWQSVTRNYRNGVYVGTTYLYTVRRNDGYQIKLNNLTRNIAELGSALNEGMRRELVPRALDAIQRGQTLTFAPFHVSQQGLGKGHEWMSWQDIQTVEVKQGRVSIKKSGETRGSWMTTVARIPNFPIFLIIVEEMKK